MHDGKNGSGIVPTGHRVLVLPDPIEEKTESGIIIKAQQTMDSERQRAVKGVVIDIGFTAWKEFASGEPWAKIGDHVVCEMRFGIELKGKDDKNYVLFNDQDILAVLK